MPATVCYSLVTEEDFQGELMLLQCLAKCRDDVCEALDLKHADVELSMGMSGDFEEAVRHAGMYSVCDSFLHLHGHHFLS